MSNVAVNFQQYPNNFPTLDRLAGVCGDHVLPRGSDGGLLRLADTAAAAGREEPHHPRLHTHSRHTQHGQYIVTAAILLRLLLFEMFYPFIFYIPEIILY